MLLYQLPAVHLNVDSESRAKGNWRLVLHCDPSQYIGLAAIIEARLSPPLCDF
jgi:hypothetical protein